MRTLSALAIGGGTATAALMLPHGLVAALLVAPFGGSALALAGGLLLAARRGDDWQSDAETDGRIDEMVAALRGIAAEGRRVEARASAQRASEPTRRTVA